MSGEVVVRTRGSIMTTEGAGTRRDTHLKMLFRAGGRRVAGLRVSKAGSDRPAPSHLPRVLLATLLRGNGSTGVETHSREVVEYLQQLGAECETVTSFSFMPPLAKLLFAPRRILARPLPAASVAWYRWSHRLLLTMSLRRLLRDESPAVIYAQCPVAADAALRARKSTTQRIVLAVHFHGSQADEWVDRRVLSPAGSVYRGIRRLEERVVPAVDGLVFVSQAARRGLAAEISGVDKVPWTHVPNFLRERPALSGPPAARSADLVTIGSLEPHKNHRFLLEVLAAAAGRGKRYSLDIIGHGSLEQSLRAQAEALGIKENVRLLGWHRDPRSLLPGHKLYVHSSIRETGPLSVLEAMSVGLPIIAPPVGEVPTILGDGTCGAMWSLEDVEEAADLLDRFLSNPTRLERMSVASRARFVESYSTERVAPRLVDFLRGVASEVAISV